MKRLGPAIARLMRLADRTLSALLMAASVTLLAAGVLWYGSPSATGADLALAAASVSTPEALADPGSFPTPASTAAVSTAPPIRSAPPGASGSPVASPSASATQTVGAPTPSVAPSASPGDPSVATRVVIPSLEIDLPVILGDLNHFPKCDVAMYHPGYVQPGEQGSTYLYAHARDGMFLPLLTASLRRNGDGMLGSLVEVYTDDDLRYVYAISLVKRHATDYSLADAVAPGVSQLVLQTSEGPHGTVPKLQVLATLQDTLPADQAAAHPKAQPRDCENSP